MSYLSISHRAGSQVKPFPHPTIPKKEDWKTFQGVIINLYQECDCRLRDVIDTMLREFNFRATKRMYTQRFREWNVAKNIGSHDVQEYLERRNHSAEATISSETSSVPLRGRVVKREKLLNYMRRRKIIHETRPDKAEACVDDRPKRGIRSMGYEPYPYFESSGENDEMCDALTSEELTSLSIAMLQTDFHYRRNDEGPPPSEIPVGPEDQLHYSLTTQPPLLRSLPRPQELSDLEFVLHNCNVAYGQFPNARFDCSQEPLRMSDGQQDQARDFYARHWLGLSLLSKRGPGSPWLIGINLLTQIYHQIEPMLSENHPHLLPWIAFVVCYPSDLSLHRTHQYHVLNRTLGKSAVRLQKTDPRLQIQKCLATSKVRRSICLVMLRHIISIFRKEIEKSHLEALDLLARLFDTIEAWDDFDGNRVEETLRRWARNSLDIAKVIEADKKTSRMEAERKSRSDPVHQAGAGNPSVEQHEEFLVSI